jgi:hypothetical protein
MSAILTLGQVPYFFVRSCHIASLSTTFPPGNVDVNEARPAPVGGPMALELPAPIAAYFRADRDGEAVSECFTEDAVVKDEGHSYRGRAAIRQWKADASAKYQYVSEPFACEQRETKIVVTSRLTGNFPGSPLNLRYFFELAGDKIAALEIIP